MPTRTTPVVTTLVLAMMKMETVAAAWRIATATIEQLSPNTLTEKLFYRNGARWVVSLSLFRPCFFLFPTRFIFSLLLSLSLIIPLTLSFYIFVCTYYTYDVYVSCLYTSVCVCTAVTWGVFFMCISRLSLSCSRLPATYPRLALAAATLLPCNLILSALAAGWGLLGLCMPAI